MSLPASVDDWLETDRWWDAFTGDRQMILAADQVRRVDEAWKQRHWGSVDQFWDGFEADGGIRPLTNVSSKTNS